MGSVHRGACVLIYLRLWITAKPLSQTNSELCWSELDRGKSQDKADGIQNYIPWLPRDIVWGHLWALTLNLSSFPTVTKHNTDESIYKHSRTRLWSVCKASLPAPRGQRGLQVPSDPVDPRHPIPCPGNAAAASPPQGRPRLKLSLKSLLAAFPLWADRNHLLARSAGAAAAFAVCVHTHRHKRVYKILNSELMMPGTKQFVTCAFMITATKGREMSFQISIERGKKRSFQRVFVLLKCSGSRSRRFLRGGGGGRI